jgi:ABC transporter substrate binding protein
MKRRAFMSLLGGAAAAWPLAARAAAGGGREADWHAGDRIAGAQRRAARRLPQGPAGTRLRRRTDIYLIVVRGTPAAIAAKNANGTIPEVMASVGEPLLVVDSLARRGRNVTGLSAFVNVMTSKRLDLIREIVPTISRIALFANMSNAVAPPQWEETKTAARSLGIEAERGQAL